MGAAGFVESPFSGNHSPTLKWAIACRIRRITQTEDHDTTGKPMKNTFSDAIDSSARSNGNDNGEMCSEVKSHIHHSVRTCSANSAWKADTWYSKTHKRREREGGGGSGWCATWHTVAFVGMRELMSVVKANEKYWMFRLNRSVGISKGPIR